MREIVSRMYPPGKEAVSFAIGEREDFFLIDGPLKADSLYNPTDCRGALYTHFHKDHCPQKNQDYSLPPSLWMHRDTLLLLDHIGVNIAPYQHRFMELYPNQFNPIDGLGRVLPIPVSHSSIDAMAFFITLNSGNTILISGDIRSGNRTEAAIAKIGQLTGKSGVSLFIGDATGMGKDHITVAEHITRIKQALKMAEANQAGTAIFVKAGDYGNIALWFEQHVFEACDVYLAPKLKQVLGDLGLLSYLYKRYKYNPPDIQNLHDHNHNLARSVFLYDDCWNNLIREKPHVLVNASRRDIPFKSDRVIAIFPIGFSGHSGDAFSQMLDACHPEYVTYSHPPEKKSPNLGNALEVIKKCSKSFELR